MNWKIISIIFLVLEIIVLIALAVTHMKIIEGNINLRETEARGVISAIGWILSLIWAIILLKLLEQIIPI